MKHWFAKQRYLIDFTLAALARHKARSFALLAIYTFLVFILASVMLYSHALREEAAHVLAESPDIIVQRMIAGRHDLIPRAYLEKIGPVRGVQRKEARLWGYYYDAVSKANYTFMVPAQNVPAPHEIIIGPTLARSRGLAVGNGISFRSYTGKLHSFTVAAVLPQTTELASADLVLINADDFRAFFDYPTDVATDIALSVANPSEVKNIAQKIATALPDTRPILRDEVLRTYSALFDWRTGIVFSLLSTTILAFAILAWSRASGLSAEEKREIGILKAIGWETSDVIKMKFWEGLLISITAFFTGFVAAYGHVFYFGMTLFEPLFKGWSVLYPRFQLTPHIDGVAVATLAFFTIVPYAAAVLLPIWQAAITDPDAVMRT